MFRSAPRVVLVALALGALPALSQDAVEANPDSYKVLVDNPHVRVVECTLKPGARDRLHGHPAGWYHVNRPGKMRVVFADGKTELWEPRLGEAGWMEAEAPHTSENLGAAPMGFILVEVKSAAPPARPSR